MDVRPTLVSQRGVRQAAEGDVRGSAVGGETQQTSVKVRRGRRGREMSRVGVERALVEIEGGVGGEGVED